MHSHEVFIHIHQGCFAGTGAIVRLPQCQWSKPAGYGKISLCITTTKHSKAKTVLAAAPQVWWSKGLLVFDNYLHDSFYINQDKTHQEGRYSFGLSSDATKYCICKRCKMKHYRLLLVRTAEMCSTGSFLLLFTENTCYLAYDVLLHRQSMLAYITAIHIAVTSTQTSIVLLDVLDEIDPSLSDTTFTSGDWGCHWPVIYNVIQILTMQIFVR